MQAGPGDRTASPRTVSIQSVTKPDTRTRNCCTAYLARIVLDVVKAQGVFYLANQVRAVVEHNVRLSGGAHEGLAERIQSPNKLHNVHLAMGTDFEIGRYHTYPAY